MHLRCTCDVPRLYLQPGAYGEHCIRWPVTSGAVRTRYPPTKHLTVGHIATELMSARQHEQAITALAILITAWQHNQDQPDSPALLPLPSPASDTDHAMTTQELTAQQPPEPVMKRQVSHQPATPGHGGDVRVGVYVRADPPTTSTSPTPSKPRTPG